MNFNDLVKQLAAKTDTQEYKIREILLEMSSCILEGLRENDEIVIHAFGKFVPQRTEAYNRKSSIPGGPDFIVPAKTKVKFVPRPSFVEELNKE